MAHIATETFHMAGADGQGSRCIEKGTRVPADIAAKLKGSRLLEADPDTPAAPKKRAATAPKG